MTMNSSNTKNWTELKSKGKGPKGLDWSGIYPSPCIIWKDKTCREIDEEAFRELLRYMIANDIAGLGLTLSHEAVTLKERLRALTIGKEESKGRLPVRAGATGQFTLQVIEEGKMMMDAGADVLYMYPTPIGNYEEKFLVDHFRRFDKALRTPFIIACEPPQVAASTIYPLDSTDYTDRRVIIVHIRPDNPAALAGHNNAQVTVTISAP